MNGYYITVYVQIIFAMERIDLLPSDINTQIDRKYSLYHSYCNIRAVACCVVMLQRKQMVNVHSDNIATGFISCYSNILSNWLQILGTFSYFFTTLGWRDMGINSLTQLHHCLFENPKKGFSNVSMLWRNGVAVKCHNHRWSVIVWAGATIGGSQYR